MNLFRNTSLGERAATRRRELKLSRVAVAGAVGVCELTLRKWEESLPTTNRGQKEDRWEAALHVPRGWLRNGAATTPMPHLKTLDLTNESLASVTEEIRAVAAWLTRASERSRSPHVNSLTEAEQRRAIMFAERYGVAGSDGVILQVIGKHFGLTRERVRQVVDVMTARANGITFVLPCLSLLRTAATQMTAISVSEFESTYRALLGPMLSLSDADRFARELLGFGIASMTERSLWQAGNALQPMVAGTSGIQTRVAVRDGSRRMIRSCGAAHVMFVTGLVSEALNCAISVQEVRQALTTIEGMEWLTDEEDWYWFGMETVNNRVLHVARKVLSVAERRLDIEELQQAVCRSRRFSDEDRKLPPAVEVPRHVLAAILSRVPWLTVVQFNDFVLNDSVQMAEVLNASELAVAEMIRRHDGAVARRLLNKTFVATGIFSGPNLQIVLASSPIIRTLGFGVYGLRGVVVSQSALSAAMATVNAIAATPATFDSKGWCEFELAITEYGIRTGVISVPARVAKAIPGGVYEAAGVLNGSFSLNTTHPSVGRLTGFVQLLRIAGIGARNRLRVRIHPGRMCATISRRSGGAKTAEKTDGNNGARDT